MRGSKGNREFYKYGTACLNAAKRGFETYLTIDEWRSKLEAAGITFEDLGNRGKESYVLGRYGDSGAYTPDNCRFITRSANAKEMWSLGNGVPPVNPKGKASSSWSGYWVTPKGCFSTRTEAAEAHGRSTQVIATRCKQPDRKVTSRYIQRSPDLTTSDLGRTYKELGYYFISKNRKD